MTSIVKYLTVLLFSFIYFLPTTAYSESLVGSSVESRVTLAFKVQDQAAQTLLPEGWKLLSLPKGPIAGANLLVAFIDKHLARDAEGKPLNPPASRTVAVVVYGVKKGVKGPRMFVATTYETPPVVDPYSNSVSANIARLASVDGVAGQPKMYRESWTVNPTTGGELSLELMYKSTKPGWKTSKAMPYSNKKPDFYRIYKYDQLAELVMSKAMKKEINGDISFKSSIPELSGMMDGSESLVGIVAIPVYVREVFLP